MYWQVNLGPEQQSSPAAEWLLEKGTPAPRKQDAPLSKDIDAVLGEMDKTELWN